MNHDRSVVLAALLSVVLLIGLALALNPSMTKPSTNTESSRTSTLASSSSQLSSIGTSSSSELLQSTTSTVTGLAVPLSSASTLDSLTGLRLNLNLSTNSNGWLIVTTYEFNTLDRVNNVSYGAGLNSSFFQYVENNCEAGGMVGYEILQGNYGLNNFTNGAALWLQPEHFGMQCGMEEPENSYYTFMPLSNQSVISGTYVGYWTDPSNDSTYHPFAPGTYTVVAGDGWGNFVILHFAVQSSQLYRVEFLQESNCPYGVWRAPWAVVVNHQTVVQPSNTTLPLNQSYDASHITNNSTYSAIWLSLPDGTYPYTILPNNFWGDEQSGNVTVDGSNVVVQVDAFITAMGCSSTTTTTEVTNSTTTSVECTITGQPGPFFLRVVWDSNQTPVAGARVEATTRPASVNGYQCSNPSILNFTTASNTEWYSLPSQNEAGYFLVVSYSGQTYNFTAGLAPVSVTCASLYIPSGRTDVTITEFQTTCH